VGRKPTERNDEDMKRDSDTLLAGELARPTYVNTQTLNLNLRKE